MLFLDLETYSDLDLRHVAVDKYAKHPSTRITLCAYAPFDEPIEVWQEGDYREKVETAIRKYSCVPWNKGFEETLLENVWKVRAPNWQDAMVMARYAGLPAGLKDCNRVPFFVGESVTSKETLLINKFCKPGKKGIVHNAQTDPEDWALFVDYCRRDVADTRLIYKWLVQHFPMPSHVYDTWLLDQKINRRGLPIDVPFVWNAKQEGDRLQALSLQQLAELTRLDNPNSVSQLLKWVTERGYPFNGLGKELVERAIEEHPDAEYVPALNLRLAGSKASIKKFDKILQQVSGDGRLREQYRFYGAHTGRWSGRGCQMHNLKAARTKEEKLMVPEVTLALEQGQPVKSLDALSLALRPAIKAPKGKKVVLADFKSVENRVLAWLAGCETMMAVYREGRDPYIDFASRMENIPYEEVSAEMRQIAKPGTLGCGFGLGGGKEIRRGKCSACKRAANVPLEAKEGVYDCSACHARAFKVGPIQKTGLWRYAEMMGVDLSQEQAQKQVMEFRTAFAEVCELWYWLEEAFIACVQTKRVQEVGVLKFRYQDPALRVVLPSGREISYVNPFAIKGRDDRGFQSVSIGFDGLRGRTWGRQSTYGGRLCENFVQAVAVDLLVDALHLIEADPLLELVGHTHDEAIALADVNDDTAVARMEAIMSRTPDWAPGLIMAADGYEGERYSKG